MRKEQLKNPRRRKKRSKEFYVGDKVLVQCEKTKKWLFKGTVTERVKEDSYNIRFKKPNETNEKIYLRNRSMMKDPAEDSDEGEEENDPNTYNGDSNKENLDNKESGATRGGNAPEKIDHPMRLRSQVRFSTHSNSRERPTASCPQRRSRPSRSSSRPRHIAQASVKGKPATYEY